MTHCRVARIKFDHGRVGSRLTLRCLTSKPPSGASRLGSVVPLPRVASTTQTDLSSARALLIDSGLATWQRRGATLPSPRIISSRGDLEISSIKSREIWTLFCHHPPSRPLCNRHQCRLRCVEGFAVTRTQRGGGSGPAAVGSCPISAWQCKGSVIARLGACAQCTSLHSVRQHPGGVCRQHA